MRTMGKIDPADGQDGERHGDAPAGLGDAGVDRGPVHEQATSLQRLEAGAQPGESAGAARDVKLLPRLRAHAEHLDELRDRLLLGRARRRLTIDQAGVLGRLERRPQLRAGLGELQFNGPALAHGSLGIAVSGDICDASAAFKAGVT
jgi:hypothetical protein